jgi:NADH dehydrogenase FAD-containing subunit
MAARTRDFDGVRLVTNHQTGQRTLRRLVLLGAGRAHLHVLHAFAKPLVRGLEIVLVTPEREHFNAAMQSGILRGAYAPDAARIDVAALADRAGARLVPAEADGVLVSERVVTVRGERIPFDACSLDDDGESEGAELPGVRSHALPLRPASVLPEVRAQIETTLSSASRRVDCVIVGGGVRGVEAAFVMRRMLGDTRHGGVVTIVDEAPTILADAEPCRDLAREALERAGVCFVLGTPAVEVREDRVLLGNGGSLPASLVLWATSARAPRLIATSGLRHDRRGRLLVDDTLRAVDGHPVWAAGSCASRSVGSPDGAKFGAAQERVLVRSLRAALDAPSLTSVRRSSRELCLVDTGDGQALLGWGGVRGRSLAAGWLKRRIDRRFVAGFARP